MAYVAVLIPDVKLCVARKNGLTARHAVIFFCSCGVVIEMQYYPLLPIGPKSQKALSSWHLGKSCKPLPPIHTPVLDCL